MATTPAASPSQEGIALLQMTGITKRFPGVVANDHVDFEIRSGEIHTLFGENGAGKSTLMRVLYGLYRPDFGEIRIKGEKVAITSPADAIRRGIGMIHQHFMLVDTLTVAENVALGEKSERGPLTDLGRVSARIRELADTYGLNVDPQAIIWQLSVGERQRVEIIKALYRNVSMLVLDEPTAVLTPREVDELFVVLRQMTEGGRGLVFISHKIHEVLDISDRITVLRGGRNVGTIPAAEASRARLVELMVGRTVALESQPSRGSGGEVRLSVEDLRVKGDRGIEAVRGLSLEVCAGEIVGIAGVSGNGQRELSEAIAGLRPALSGSIRLGDAELAGANPADARAAGLAYVPEERMRDGVVPAFTVAQNLLLVENRDRNYSRLGFLRTRAIRRHCQELIAAFDVRTPSLDTPARNLSGGNIQKLIMARELSGSPRVLLVAQPTRGIDVGATRYIHERLVVQRDNGTAVLIISEDLDEIMTICDRVLVMYEGTIIGAADPRVSTREEIGMLMAGVRSAVPAAPPPPAGEPLHRLQVIGADLGLATLQEVQRHARHAQAVVAAQRVQRGAAGDRGVHQHERQPGAVPLAQCQHLRSDDIEEACAGLDLEQRLRPRQAHARPQPAVELDDHQPVEHFTGLAGWRLGQLVQAWQVRKRLQGLARQESGLLLAQLPQAPAQGGQLSGVDASGLGLGQDSGNIIGRIHALTLL